MNMPDPAINEFLYRPNRFVIAALFALALCGGCLFGYFAVNPGAIPVKACGIELTPAQFQVLAVIVVALSPIGLVPLAMLLVFSFTHDSRIAFTANSVILPKPNRFGLPSREIELPFAEISSFSVKPFVGKALMLQIVCKSDSRVVRIFSNMFANRKDFETVQKLLSAALTRTLPVKPSAR